MNTQTLAPRLVSLLALAMVGGQALAQSFTMDWSTLDTGGTLNASGAAFSVNATAGQIDGVAPGYGAPYNLRPGFWGGRPCVADLTGDAAVDLSDFFAFFGCFDLSAPCADLDGSSEVDLLDFFAFFAAFDQGC